MQIKITELSFLYLDYEYLRLLSQLSGSEPTERVDFLQIWESYTSSPAHIYIAIDLDTDKVVGSASVFIERKILHNGSAAGHIEDVVVDEHYRGYGIGNDLIQRCLLTAEQYGCYKVVLDCADDVVDFYSKLGFKKAGNYMRIKI